MRAEFMIDRNGKSFCLYAGLLDEAHQQGLKEIKTLLVQIPTNENGNVAICQSEVRTEKGVFTGLGDASPQNVSRAMLTCLIRMAETRAKARALRDAVNVGVAALEELDSEAAGTDRDDAHSVGSGNGGRSPVRMSSFSASPEVFTPRAAQRPSQEPGASTVRPAEVEPSSKPSTEPARPTASYGRSTRGGISAGDELNGAASAASDGADVITSAQRRMLEALARQTGDQISLDGLSRREASQLITDLKARLAAPKAA